MKIAFLAGGQEPGTDGVGDYTRSLACEIARQDHHETCIVGLADPFVSSPERNTLENDVQQLRLPSSFSWQERSDQAGAFLDEFAPDIVSLQFVPYTFNPKGVVRGMRQYLQTLVKNRIAHLMFHELWIGDGCGASPKERLVGAVQRHYVLSLLRGLKPAVIHTTNRSYMELFRQQGITAKLLPLFGSIPVSQSDGSDWLFPLLQNQGVQINTSNRGNFWVFGFFGTFHPEWSPEPLFGSIRQAANSEERQVVMLSVGGMGGRGAEYWNELKTRYAPDWPLISLGKQPEKKVSQFFNSLDFGIATSPLSLIGKSSCATSMFEHGLPVIINRDDVSFRGIQRVQPDYKGTILNSEISSLTAQLTETKRQPARSYLHQTAIQLLLDLKSKG